MDKYEKRDRVRGQVRTLECFYKNLRTYEVSYIGARLVAWILLPIATLLIWIPYQSLDGVEQAVFAAAYLLWLGEFMYLNQYMSIGEGKRVRSIAEKLKYLPVDRRSICFFLLKKLSRLLLIVGVIQLVGQCLIAVFSYGRLELCNVLYPLLVGTAIPGAANALCIAVYVAAAKS